MWQDKLKEIIYILEHSAVNEIEVRIWGKTYRVVKAVSEKDAAPDESVAPAVRSTAESSDDSQESVKIENEQSGDKINSPMPGTFYRSSSPDADPFVQEGDQVVKGDTLCIIEAMKIMNEIEAEENGTIEKVLIENGSPVEFDQPLFVLRSE